MDIGGAVSAFLKGWGSLTIATVALIQPWVIGLWKRFFRPGDVDIYESGVMDLGYSVYGPTIGFRGTLRAVHRDQFIRKIELTVVKQKDGSTHTLDWLLFRAEKLNPLGAEEITSELASGFMLLTTQPHHYSILFHDAATQTELQPHTAALINEWNRYRSEPAQTAALAAQQDIYEAFRKRPLLLDTWEELRRRMYWEEGTYSLELRVRTARPENTITRRWTFDLSEEDSKRLRLNAGVLCDLYCGQSGTYFFAFPRYAPEGLPATRR